MIAGFDSAGNDSSSVFVYDGTAWSRGPALPLALNHAAATVASDRLYVAGGFRGAAATPDAFVLSASGLTWEAVAPMRRARGALALAGIGARVYALGGRDAAGEIAIPEAYDTSTGAWSDLPPLPQPRDHLAGFGNSQSACVAGGISPATARVDCFDPSLQLWTRMTDMPWAAKGPGAASLGSAPMIAGGENGTETQMVDRVARWRGVWASEPMLEPRHGFELAVFRGRFWACGGGGAPGLHPVGTCTSLAP